MAFLLLVGAIRVRATEREKKKAFNAQTVLGRVEVRGGDAAAAGLDLAGTCLRCCWGVQVALMPIFAHDVLQCRGERAWDCCARCPSLARCK